MKRLNRRTRLLIALAIFLGVVIATINPFRRKGVDVALSNHTSVAIAEATISYGPSSVKLVGIEPGRTAQGFIPGRSRDQGLHMKLVARDPLSHEISDTFRAGLSSVGNLRSAHIQLTETIGPESRPLIRMTIDTEESFDLSRIVSDLYHGRGLGRRMIPGFAWQLGGPAAPKPA